MAVAVAAAAEQANEVSLPGAPGCRFEVSEPVLVALPAGVSLPRLEMHFAAKVTSLPEQPVTDLHLAGLQLDEAETMQLEIGVLDLECPFGALIVHSASALDAVGEVGSKGASVGEGSDFVHDERPLLQCSL